MNRAELNQVGNPDSGRRRDRRQRFIDQFERLPLGTFNLPELALRTRIPYKTALAYLQQLHREAKVEHESGRASVSGFQFYVAVWSKIK